MARSKAVEQSELLAQAAFIQLPQRSGWAKITPEAISTESSTKPDLARSCAGRLDLLFRLLSGLRTRRLWPHLEKSRRLPRQHHIFLTQAGPAQMIGD